MGPSEEAGREVSCDERAWRRTRRRTLAVGLALIVAAVAVTLSRGAEHRAGTNGLPARVFLGVMATPSTICQTNEPIPAGTAALRVRAIASSYATPRITVTLAQDGGAVEKSTDARWEGRRALVVAFPQPLRTPVRADVCVQLHASGDRTYAFKGVPTYPGDAATSGGQPLPGRMHIEYLSDGGGSWGSFASTIARRIGRGHAWPGASVALLAALLMLTSIALSGWQLSRTDR